MVRFFYPSDFSLASCTTFCFMLIFSKNSFLLCFIKPHQCGISQKRVQRYCFFFIWQNFWRFFLEKMTFWGFFWFLSRGERMEERIWEEGRGFERKGEEERMKGETERGMMMWRGRRAARLQNDSGDITLWKLGFYLVISPLLLCNSYAFGLRGVF